MQMNLCVQDSVALFDKIFPDRPPFMNMVSVINPEITKYVIMALYKKKECEIPWKDIYEIIKTTTEDDIYIKVQEKIKDILKLF
jgi:hypothetical protein